jgi:cellobiose phosphorylase
MAVQAYIKESGDKSILEEKVGYYKSDLAETVFLHMKRGIDYLYSHQGEHGLSLWGGGDWNDSMNNCGLQMKGESVWLSIATVKATDDYLDILTHCFTEGRL